MAVISLTANRLQSQPWGLWAAAMLVSSVAALFYARRAPKLATALSTCPFVWLLWQDTWVGFWWVAQLGVLALAASRSWRHAAWSAVGALVTWVLLMYHGFWVAWTPGYPYRIYNPEEEAVPWLLLICVAAVLPAAASTLIRSDAARRGLSKREAAVKQVGTAQAERDGDEMVLTVANEAPPHAEAWPGPTATGEGDGLGLTGMTERVEALGGILVAGPDAAGGFRVTARLPIYERGR
jgi:hypothetical protein